MPHVMNELNAKSFDLKYEILRNGEDRAEVLGRQWTFTRKLENFMHIADILEKTCTSREWQLTGKPCFHAITFITSFNEDIENYVDHYYSIEKFKATYAGRVPACVDKNQWPKSDHGLKLHMNLELQQKRKELHTNAPYAKVLDIIEKNAKKVTLMPSKHLQF
jgi:hypothetical protein